MKTKQPGQFVVLSSMMPRALALDVMRLAEKKGLTTSMLIRNIVGPIVRDELERQP